MSRARALFDRIDAAQARLETLQAGTDPESPLGRLDTFMAGFDHMGTGDTADAAASIEEWAELRADLTGVIRRPFGYSGPVFPLDACVWFRESTLEWVLEIACAINDTFLVSRHTQPGDLAPEDVPGLPALHGAGAALTRDPPEPEPGARLSRSLLITGWPSALPVLNCQNRREIIMPENTPDKQQDTSTARPPHHLAPAESWAVQDAEAISERRALIEANGTPLADLQVLRLD